VKQLFYSHGRVTPERCTNPFLKALTRKNDIFLLLFLKPKCFKITEFTKETPSRITIYCRLLHWHSLFLP